LRRPAAGPVLAGAALVLASYAIVVVGCQFIFGSGATNWVTWIPGVFRSLVPGSPAVRYVTMAVCLGFLVPIAEEAFYRGVMHDLVGRSLGRIAAVVLTAAGWAAVHLGDYGLHPFRLSVALGAVASVFVMGLALGICRLLSGSFLASAAAQGAANLALLAWVLAS
jgi:membrane protease YdiL (CAAX protease family)